MRRGLSKSPVHDGQLDIMGVQINGLLTSYEGYLLFSRASYIASGNFNSWMTGRDVGSLCTNVAVMLIAIERIGQINFCITFAGSTYRSPGQVRQVCWHCAES